jgi:hypothetical protein
VKTRNAALILVLLGVVPVGLLGSGQAGIYGVVEQVVLEPNTGSAERIQVWGAFALIEHMPGQGFTNYVFNKPTRGYLYFKLPVESKEIENARREWADLKSVAGTRQAVAFGYWNRLRGDKLMRIRDQASKPEDPDMYYTDIGVVKLSGSSGHAGIVAELMKLVER